MHKWSNGILKKVLGRWKWGIWAFGNSGEGWTRLNRWGAVEEVLIRERSPKRPSTSLECWAQSTQNVSNSTESKMDIHQCLAFSWLLLFASSFKTRSPRSWKCGWDQVADCAQELGAIQGVRKPQKSSKEVSRMANFLFMGKTETRLDAGRWAERAFPSWNTLTGLV